MIFNILIFLLILNLIAGNFGIQNIFFVRIIAFYLLIAAFLININFQGFIQTIQQKKSQRTILLGLLLSIISIFLLFSTTYQEVWLLQPSIFLLGMIYLSQGIGQPKQEILPLAIMSLFYALFLIILQNTLSPYWFFEEISLQISYGISKFVQPVVLGAAASGFWIFISFVFFVIISYFLSPQKKQRKYLIFTIICLLGLLVGWIVYILIQSLYPFESILERINSSYLLFIINAIVLVLFLIKTECIDFTLKFPSYQNWKRLSLGKKGSVVGLVLLLFLSGFFLTIFLPSINTTENKTIGVYQPGIGVGGLDLPEYGRYGRQAAGFFGILPQYLQSYGFTVEVFGENITRDTLEEWDSLVIINLGETFSDEVLEEIWWFVEQGGSLLVLGDHTDIGGIMTPLNTLLDPVGIRFKFDSGIPIKDRWKSSYLLMHHPIAEGLTKSHQIDVSVGASLELDLIKGSFPLILGKGGFSDIGNYLDVDRSFLGDYELNPGEQLGDVILVAGAYYGAGRVVVFGDTSSFQNLALSSSHHMVSNIFSWLTSDDTGVFFVVRICVSLVLLAGALVLFYKYHRRLFIVLPVFLCAAVVTTAVYNPMIAVEREIAGPVAFIDASHGERINRDYYKDDSITGLMLNIIRNEYAENQRYLPYVMDEFSGEKLRDGKILVLVAPTKPFSSQEVVDIVGFVTNGGLLIISVGYDDKAASSELLHTFGFDILPEPFGPVPYVDENPEASETEPRFVDSWPIYVEAFDNNTNVFYSVEFGEDVSYLVVFKKIGVGGVLVIGDSQFLLDSNLESLYENWPGNIDFIRNIFAELDSQEVPK